MSSGRRRGAARRDGRQVGTRRRWNGRVLRRLLLAETVLLVLLVAFAILRAGWDEARQQPGAALERRCGGAGTFQSGDARAVVCEARVRLYPFTTPLLGLMSPAIAPGGTLWVGAMASNSLLQFDTRTGTVDSWAVPEGRNLVMETAVDVSGNIWFAEQGAGYLGRLEPATRAITTFPLRTPDGAPAGVQALWFDRSGGLWFSVPKGGWVGRFDPRTANARFYAVPPPAPGVTATPYDLALAPNGRVWFGYLGGGAMGELDPATGTITLHRLADARTEIYAIAPDGKGRIWFSQFTAPRIGYVEEATGAVREFDVPTTLGRAAPLYGVSAAPNGDIWFGSLGASALVRFVPGSQEFTFFQVRIGKNAPYELTFDFEGRLWFTSQGDTPSYIGTLTP